MEILAKHHKSDNRSQGYWPAHQRKAINKADYIRVADSAQRLHLLIRIDAHHPGFSTLNINALQCNNLSRAPIACAHHLQH